MRTRIEAIRKEIHADAERRDALTGQLKQADLQIQSARERLADVRSRRIDSEQKLAGLKTEHPQDYDDSGINLVLQSEAGIHQSFRSAQVGLSSVVMAVAG